MHENTVGNKTVKIVIKGCNNAASEADVHFNPRIKSKQLPTMSRRPSIKRRPKELEIARFNPTGSSEHAIANRMGLAKVHRYANIVNGEI